MSTTEGPPVAGNSGAAVPALSSGSLPSGLMLMGSTLCVALAVDAYVGFFTRYAADDYCTSATVHSFGFWGAQRYWFYTWTGRYSATAGITAAEALGTALVPFLPAVILLLWAATLGWVLSQIAVRLGCPAPIRTALLLDLLVLFLTLHSTFNLGLTLYWLTGMITYTVPVVGLCAGIGLIQHWFAHRKKVTVPMQMFAGCWAFLLSGTSETFAALLFMSLVLAYLGMCITGKRAFDRMSGLRSLLRVAILGASCAVLIMLASPGNAVRQGTLSRPPSLFAAFYLSLRLGCYFIIRFIVCQWDKFALALFVPAMLPFFGRPRCVRSRLWLALLPALALVLSVTSFFPAAFVYFAPLAGYALGASQFILVLLVVGWSYLLGSHLSVRFEKHHRLVTPIGSVLMIALALMGPGVAMERGIERSKAAHQYARAWDALDSRIRAQKASGMTEITAEPLPWNLSNTDGLEVPSHSPHDWVNAGMADYYGLRSVVFTGPYLGVPSDNWTPGCCDSLWKRFKHWRKGSLPPR